MTEWIKCSERLPLDQSFIIAYGKRQYECDWDGTEDEEPDSVWNAYFSLGDFYCFCARSDGDKMDEMNASHWMPLPSPPSKKKCVMCGGPNEFCQMCGRKND